MVLFIQFENSKLSELRKDFYHFTLLITINPIPARMEVMSKVSNRESSIMFKSAFSSKRMPIIIIVVLSFLFMISPALIVCPDRQTSRGTQLGE